MAQQRLTSVFLFVQLLCLVLSDEQTTTEWEYKYEDYAFNQFMNTSEPIWVVNTTQPQAPLCTKDVNSNMTINNETFFTRSYKKGDEYTHKQLKGEFGYHDEGKAKMFDRMTVFEVQGGEYVDDEVLEYVSHGDKCAVVTVMAYINSDTKVWRDVRVRNAYLNDTTSNEYKECLKRFADILKVTNKNWTSPYSEECEGASSETNKTP
uniref:Lipocalin n=1 Tax=Rhipicephalus zambeziensis TaxID=60191 RepID=A0A224YCE4_9ACAR